jgi:dTDP-L-rhamnose 4-epimerase
MRILITGGGGFIGTVLTKRLLEDGHEVRIVDPLTPQIHGEIPSFETVVGAEFVRSDIRAIRERPELLSGIDVVYHLAAETGTGQSMYQIGNYVDVNEMGTARLLEAIAAQSRRPKKLILSSSRAIYGEGAYRPVARPGEIVHPGTRSKTQLDRHLWEPTDEGGSILFPIPTPETLAPRPGSVYAATKIAQEYLVSTACEGLGVEATILRFQNVYGEGQSLQNPYTGVLSIFFNRARQGLELNIYEDGQESRDFVHVSDVCESLVLSLRPGRPTGRIYNVGSGKPTSLLEMAHALLEVSGFSTSIRVSGDFRVGDIRHCYADLTRIGADLGFAPAVDFREGLGRFVAWAKAQHIYVDRSEQAICELRQRGLANG